MTSNPLACETPANILTITANDAVEVIRIAPDGRLFWRGREVDTDIDFRAAMLELAEKLVAPPPGIERLRAALQRISQAELEDRGDEDDWVDGYCRMRDIAREALRGADETTPNLNCPTCGLLYSGRGGQRGMPVRLSCTNGHEWNDPRGGCNP